ncbi:hypothetical protein Emed_004828 [Eimeria media]
MATSGRRVFKAETPVSVHQSMQQDAEALPRAPKGPPGGPQGEPKGPLKTIRGPSSLSSFNRLKLYKKSDTHYCNSSCSGTNSSGSSSSSSCCCSLVMALHPWFSGRASCLCY